MIQRFLYTGIRYIWLLIIPLVIGPLLSLYLIHPTYTAVANLWVEQPLYVDPQRKPDGSSIESPAAQVADLLKELLATRSFATSVLYDSAAFRVQVTNPTDREGMITDMAKTAVVDASGWQLINLSYTTKDPDLSQQIINAIVTRFSTFYTDRITSQATSAITYYQGQIQKTQQRLADANNALQKFIQDHPDTVTTGTQIHAVRPEDLTFGTLTQDRDAARSEYDAATQALEKTQASYSAFLGGQDTTLRVQDKPQLLDQNRSKLRDLAINGGIGLAGGLLVALAVLSLLTLLDNRLHLPVQARQMAGNTWVMTMANIEPKRSWRKRSITGRVKVQSKVPKAALLRQRIGEPLQQGT